jgi:hypothetical protein
VGEARAKPSLVVGHTGGVSENANLDAAAERRVTYGA